MDKKKGSVIGKGKKEEEQPRNLFVATRIRPLNQNEKEEGSVLVAKADQMTSHVHVKHKSYGPFDKVYGPSSTQKQIFEDIVRPSVQRTVQGYNCTVFAYGQTGTGKTYTMEGGNRGDDIVSSAADPTTGLIPRAVEHIFDELQRTQATEYTVRVSYLELYNEELFDLLAPNTGEKDKLRIFEDQNKKGGVFVANLEEMPVLNRHDVFKLLKAGAEKRRTAATLMNVSSSRSHTVFCVTVLVKETSDKGEELVKMGKLNLVDLAGSESIGRSGALGKTAKEAGSINQSLLTLGRVITALTLPSQLHVPYRESKLTRLLQDSLGGSTITSLIATISPASSNFEESVSTLEYALRARHIENRPVVNQKVAAKALLSNYAEEIERLRKDYKAVIEKTGIYLSQESYNKYEEASKRAIELDEVCSRVSKQLEQAAEDLALTDKLYSTLYKRAAGLEQRLTDRTEETNQLKMELEKKKEQLKAYEHTLIHMEKVAGEVKISLEKAVEVGNEQKEQLIEVREKYDNLWKMATANHTATSQIKAKVHDSAMEFTSVLEQLRAQFTALNDEDAKQFDSAIGTIKDLLIAQKATTQSTMTETRQAAEREAEEQSKAAELLMKMQEEDRQRAEMHVAAMQTSIVTLLDKATQAKRSIEAGLKQVTELTEGCAEDVKAARAEAMEKAEEARLLVETEADNRRQAQQERTKKIEEAVQLILATTKAMQEDEMKWHDETVLTAQNNYESTVELWQGVEAVCRGMTEQVDESVKEIEETTDKMDKEMGQNGKDAEKTIDLMKQEEVKRELNLKEGMKKRAESMKVHIEGMKEKYNELEKSLEMHEEQTGQCLQTLALGHKQHIQSVTECMESVVAKATTTCQLHTDAIDTLVNSKWQHHIITGETPKAKRYAILETAIPIVPDSEELLDLNGYNVTVRRSQFNRRDTLLELPSNVMSPSSLAAKRVFKPRPAEDSSEENAAAAFGMRRIDETSDDE